MSTDTPTHSHLEALEFFRHTYQSIGRLLGDAFRESPPYTPGNWQIFLRESYILEAALPHQQPGRMIDRPEHEIIEILNDLQLLSHASHATHSTIFLYTVL